jgi:hypothetical protein
LLDINGWDRLQWSPVPCLEDVGQDVRVMRLGRESILIILKISGSVEFLLQAEQQSKILIAVILLANLGDAASLTDKKNDCWIESTLFYLFGRFNLIYLMLNPEHIP